MFTNILTLGNCFRLLSLLFKEKSHGSMEMESKLTFGKTTSWLKPRSLRIRICHPLKEWLTTQHKCTLFDISRWCSNFGLWIGWNLGEIPENLSKLVGSLISSLQGLAPRHMEDQDERGWGE
jgi:hypothetical protein